MSTIPQLNPPQDHHHHHPPALTTKTHPIEPDPTINQSEDPDALLATLEAEEEDEEGYPPHLRESRAQALATELRHARQYPRSSSSNQIQELHSDAEVLTFTTQPQTSLVHFSHPDFGRCGVMDAHLRVLAGRHGAGGTTTNPTAATGGVRFGRVDVRAAPFVVERLGVRVLPCVVGFRDGVAVGRVVGFEGLGVGVGSGGVGGEEGVGVTRAIEAVVVGWGVFAGRTRGWGVSGNSSGEDDDGEEGEQRRVRRKNGGGLFGNGSARSGIQGRKKGAADDDNDDDDWD